MGDRYKIRVSKDDKNEIKWELMRNGEKIDDMSFLDIIELGLQCVTVLRWKGQ